MMSDHDRPPFRFLVEVDGKYRRIKVEKVALDIQSKLDIFRYEK